MCFPCFQYQKPLARRATRGVWILSLALLGCGPSPSLKYAKSGDLVELRAALKHEPPSASETRKLSRALLKHEILSSQDKRDREFIPALQACSRDLASALKQRAKIHDGVGAEAKLLLLELDLVHNPKRYAGEKDGAWRAIAARASAADPELRTRYYVDPDERVRRAALLAARDAHDPTDVPLLLEVARLDPDPRTRSLALLTLGHFGNKGLSQALYDRFSQMDETLRLAVVQAWGSSTLYMNGGRHQLLHLITHKTGLEVVTAASILARDKEAALANRAVTRLVRFMTEGTSDEQRLALMMMPVSNADTSQALLEATTSTDARIAVIAWSRLLPHKQYQSSAELELLKMAGQTKDPSLALQAQSALAASGSDKVTPVLKRQLQYKDPTVRKLSGLGLIRLGSLTEAAALLADDEPDVRRTIACRISAAPSLPVPLSP